MEDRKKLYNYEQKGLKGRIRGGHRGVGGSEVCCQALSVIKTGRQILHV